MQEQLPEKFTQLPLPEQIEHLSRAILYLANQVEDMRDMNRESETPIMQTLQNLHLRTCALENYKKPQNLTEALSSLPDVLKNAMLHPES